MASKGDKWRGWVGVVVAVILAAGVVMADRETQLRISRVHEAALADADAAELNMHEVGAIIGQTRAAVELSVIAADEAGAIELDPTSRATLIAELEALSSQAGLNLSAGLDRATRLDIRMETLVLISGHADPRPIAPNILSLRSTIAEAAATGSELLIGDGAVTDRDIGSLRSRLDGAQALLADITAGLTNSAAELDDVRSSIRWRIHMLFGVAMLALGWFGYQGWRGAISRRPKRNDPTNLATD